MSELLLGYDCSTPITPPAGHKVTGGYIGGATPHVWTEAEWATKSLPLKLPIYVPTYFRTGTLTPGADAIECVDRLKALPGIKKGDTVGLDFETLISNFYVESFNSIVTSAGYKVLLYGSSSTIFQNPETSAGYWVATRPANKDYPGDGVLFPRSIATQYNDFGSYDINVFSNSIQFWGSTAVVTPPETYWTDSVIQNLPTLVQGATGETVKTLQGLLTARGHAVSIDAQFGPQTALAVRVFQLSHRVPDSVVNGHGDGHVGQHTWAALITNAVG